jgi:Ca2+-binding EF-hand superfamily protein
MKPAALSIAVFLAGAAAANAQTTLDANGDGKVTYDEMVAVYPDVTEDQFIAADTNDDGLLDEAELAAAQEAGTLPMSDDM